jgi:hypothetical protein
MSNWDYVVIDEVYDGNKVTQTRKYDGDVSKIITFEKE